LVKYPITAVIGNRGSGKTCFLTFLAVQYHKEGKKIFTNFELKGIPHEKMNLGIMATLPDKLSNAVVLMDELHMGADSYDFMKKSSRAFNTFATQLRKRKVNWYFTTQIFTQVARRIRLQTDFMITMENTKKKISLNAPFMIVEVQNQRNRLIVLTLMERLTLISMIPMKLFYLRNQRTMNQKIKTFFKLWLDILGDY